jgi:hypothetical protein
MAITNHERVGKALELLKTGLSPFIQREMINVYKEGAADQYSGPQKRDSMLRCASDQKGGAI